MKEFTYNMDDYTLFNDEIIEVENYLNKLKINQTKLITSIKEKCYSKYSEYAPDDEMEMVQAAFYYLLRETPDYINSNYRINELWTS